MVDIGTGLNQFVGGVQGATFGVIGIVAWIALIVIFSSIGGVVAFLLVRRKKFNNKIIISEKINNVWQITGRDRAAEIRHGFDGTTIFYCKRKKKFLPKPVHQIGARTFLYKIREDGEWINIPLIQPEDDPEKMKGYMMHNDMRLARASLQKRRDERYEKKPSWLAQNWTWIAGISFVMVLAVSVFLLFDKWIELARVTNQGVESARLVLERTEMIIAKLDNLQSGSGYVEVASNA